MKTKILEKFKALYGDGAVCYASPGRVNLIGEHTDYNMGFVMPGAIDKAIYVAVKPNGGKVSHVSVSYTHLDVYKRQCSINCSFHHFIVSPRQQAMAPS